VNLGTANFQRVSSVRLAAVETVGGNTVQGTVIIQDRVAPAGGFTLNLRSSNPAVARVPATVTVPAGSDRATFTVVTSPVATSTPALISADDTGLPDTTVLWVDPGAAPAATLSSVTVNPTSVTGGSSSTGTITLTAPAPAGGLVVNLTSSNTAAATVPASVTVPAGASSATFTVTTVAVSVATTVTITGAAGGVTRSATLTVNPTAPAALSGLSINPTSVRGGVSATGTVTLTRAAPAGGFAVSLSSSNTGVATVPASVTLPAGATSANFTITTRAVTVQTSVTITASAGGVTRQAFLTVTPQPADTVAIQRAEYRSGSRELRIEATSTSSSATLRVYRTATNELIGTLRNEGGGRYRGQFTWPVNPQNITVRSSVGGSASRTVTAT
jgi:hypothetical protein